MNRLGICLTPESKINLIGQFGKGNNIRIRESLKIQPLCKLVGDNCDLRITAVGAGDRQPKDEHYFSLMLVFSRLAEINPSSNPSPIFRYVRCTADMVLPSAHDEQHLLNSYSILLGRLLVSHCKEFAWMEPLVSRPIKHSYSDGMAKKSTTIPLTMLFKNEAKYEDCVDIMDESERLLTELYQETFGKFIWITM